MKSLDFVIKKTQSKYNHLPKEQVEKLIKLFWEETYRKILKLDSSTITVRHVGSWTVSRYQLNRYLRKSIKRIRVIKNSKWLTPEKKEKFLAKDYKNLRTALRRRKEIAKRYAEMFKNI